MTQPDFDGATYQPELDRDRLMTQFQAVKAVMIDGEWHSLAGLSSRVGAPTASVSARLRDLRKTKFGGYTVERKRSTMSSGTHLYRLTPPTGRPRAIRYRLKDPLTPVEMGWLMGLAKIHTDSGSPTAAGVLAKLERATRRKDETTV